MSSLSTQEKVKMFETMLRIRRFEETAIELFTKGKIGGAVHTCCGQEAVATGVCKALTEQDYIVSNHRGHGHNIAKGADINKLMAELHGKKDGYCGGKGGSMHIAAVDRGVLGCIGIVGGGFPIAVGAGLTIKLKKEEKVVAVFFGDGASNEGAFHESLNMASIWKLPVLFICENNGYAVSTSAKEAVAVEKVSMRAAGYGIPGVTADGMDVEEVYENTKQAVDRARNGEGPTLVEFLTYRFLGHSRGDPPYGPYRTKEEWEAWRQRDPIPQYAKRIGISVYEEKEIRERVEGIITKAVDFADKSPYPDLHEAFTQVYSAS